MGWTRFRRKQCLGPGLRRGWQARSERSPVHPSISPYAEPADLQRQTTRAEALSHEAAELIYTDPVKAEKLLREALVADLFYGPAHNNLGVLFLNAGKLYEAAHEFEWRESSCRDIPMRE